jgi:hypothetical protein
MVTLFPYADDTLPQDCSSDADHVSTIFSQAIGALLGRPFGCTIPEPLLTAPDDHLALGQPRHQPYFNKKRLSLIEANLAWAMDMLTWYLLGIASTFFLYVLFAAVTES